jgi:hypothetical protein
MARNMRIELRAVSVKIAKLGRRKMSGNIGGIALREAGEWFTENG